MSKRDTTVPPTSRYDQTEQEKFLQSFADRQTSILIEAMKALEEKHNGSHLEVWNDMMNLFMHHCTVVSKMFPNLPTTNFRTVAMKGFMRAEQMCPAKLEADPVAKLMDDFVRGLFNDDAETGGPGNVPTTRSNVTQLFPFPSLDSTKKFDA